VLGAATLAALHKHVGDRVAVSDGGPRPFSLRIAGTATLPSLGVQVTRHPEMGTGAVLDYRRIPGALASQPNEVLVTLRPDADAAAARARLQQLVPVALGGSVSGVQRPAEITDYQAMGLAPALLAGTLALAAVASLWLTLMASVRRRRRALAVLKTLGFTRGQVAAAVTWQSATAVLAGVIPGIPLGIALGRVLWTAFARQISVVPDPAVPVPAVALIAAGALAFAGLAALWPGRLAARVPAATMLRAE
jgi:predicted lysophospholipase L1 biosynthesis ABC-type transport system permease subunit